MCTYSRLIKRLAPVSQGFYFSRCDNTPIFHLFLFSGLSEASEHRPFSCSPDPLTAAAAPANVVPPRRPPRRIVPERGGVFGMHFVSSPPPPPPPPPYLARCSRRRPPSCEASSTFSKVGWDPRDGRSAVMCSFALSLSPPTPILLLLLLLLPELTGRRLLSTDAAAQRIPGSRVGVVAFPPAGQLTVGFPVFPPAGLFAAPRVPASTARRSRVRSRATRTWFIRPLV